MHMFDEMAGFRTLLRFLMFAALIFTATWTFADRQATNRITRDSIVVKGSQWNELPVGRIAHSVHPVKLTVKGRSLKITSKYEQILPIYTKNGTLYIAMQLNSGVNWLHGLPQGRYRINNRTINIK